MTYKINGVRKPHRHDGNFYFEVFRQMLGDDELAAIALDIEYRAVERDGRTAYVIGDRDNLI